MYKSISRLIALGLLLISIFPSSSNAITPNKLEQLLKPAQNSTFIFKEVTQSPWLKTPAVSIGLMYARSTFVEKHVTLPREETWRLYSGYMEWRGPDGIGYKKIPYSRSLQLASLANALRDIVKGRFLNLEHNFNVVLNGNETAWHVLLTPRELEANHQLHSIALDGAKGHLASIIIEMQNGERTTTHLSTLQ